MLLLTNIIVVILLVSGVYAGLDKLISIALYLGILVASEVLNSIASSITQECKLVKYLFKLFKEKFPPEKIQNKIKFTFYLLSFFVWIAFAIELVCLTNGHGLSVYDSYNSRIFCICAYLLLFFYAIFAKRTQQPTEDSIETATNKNIQWYRLLQYLCVYQFVFGVYFLIMYDIEEEVAEAYNLHVIFDYSIMIVIVFLFCLLSERLLDNYRILASNSSGKEQRYEVPFFVSILAADNSFKHSMIRTIELISGVDLSKSEMAIYIADRIEPVSITALIIFWLISSIVIVPPDQEAIFSRCGKIVGNQSYKPGLHFKLPWPFETIKLYNPSEVKVMNIGFKPDPEKKDIIWSKSHAAENFFLLVGDGVEIISVDCQLFYRINNLYKFVTKMQNPEAYLEALTYKLITDTTVSSNFDGIVSQNRDALISELRNNLQKEIDKADLGVTAVEIVILAIHPPLEVADVYEDVISAQIDKQMFILKAKSETIHNLYMNKALAISNENAAKSYAENTIAKATGEAASFENRIIGYNTDPELEEFRLRLDSLQKMASSKNLYVIDKSFMRNNDRIMLNLQN